MKRYRTYREYLKEAFGEKVQKVMIDAGFTCPNRDGVKGEGGCTFCDEAGSASTLVVSSLSVREQVSHGIRQCRQKDVRKFIAYFQAFTNTYAPVDRLRELYFAALDHPQVAGLSVGTRPDCVSEGVLDLLCEIQDSKPVWIEYGLQSKFNQTLEKINRGHTAEEFADAVTRTQERGLPVTAHLILGLPGETPEMMLESARFVAGFNPFGIKIHNLYLERGMPLTEEYQKKSFQLMSQKEYVRLVCDILEILPRETVIERLTGEPDPKKTVAPHWAVGKAALLTEIDRELKRRNSCQGKFASHKPDYAQTD